MKDIEEKKNKIKYLLFDLDGTLLSADKTITQSSAEILKELQAKGMKVAFSTGRSLSAMGGITYPVRFVPNGASIGCAGGEIARFVYGDTERLFYIPFPIDALRQLLHYTLEEGLNFSLDGVGNRYYSEELYYAAKYKQDRAVAVENGIRYPELIGLNTDTVDMALDGTVVKPMIWYKNEEEKQRIVAWGKDHTDYSLMASGFKLLEVMPKAISKASALEKLCEIEGLDPEECCVFGDSQNDIPIMSRAGLSVAMCDGFRETCEAADLITGRGFNCDGAALMAANLFLQ